MARFSGDFQGPCGVCGEYVEFAVGVRTDGDPVALQFGPGGPQPIVLKDVEPELLVEDERRTRFRFQCPLCGEWSAGRATCRDVASGPEAGSAM
ncbi:MAG: hypothetical protein L6Q92_02350 [Phycisphaerae bacterium]|nr:hypothetical protein [Phycisphaerae bacterium]